MEQEIKIKIKLDGKDLEIDSKKSILNICKENNIIIPTLCYQKGLFPEARCRVCLVEMNGILVTSCSTFPLPDCEIVTKSEKVKNARKRNLELINPNLSKISVEDESEIKKIFEQVGLEANRFEQIKEYYPDLGDAIVRDNNKCINCGRCVQVCRDIQGVSAIDFSSRGHNEHVTPYMNKKLSEVACINCGQCIVNCPVGAIYERSHIEKVIEAIEDPNKIVIAQTAPSVRVALGEMFSMPPGSIVTKKMVAGIRACGFDRVFDTNLSADLTIMEEGSELLERVKNGGPFPLITSCCPGWILMAEHFYHDALENLSSCKSPQEMLSSLIKTYYADKKGINPKNIVVVSIMPCTAKKFESRRPEMERNTDYVLTTREIGKLMKQKKIDIKNIEEEDFDPALGISTGAAAIFGASGGVMEAALRTAYEVATGESVERLEFDQIRNNPGIREGEIVINGQTLKFAVANGGANIQKLLKDKDKYHFIEMMACPGGCINGGGQPISRDEDIVAKRRKAIYTADANLPLRKSHENPVIQKLYKEFLGEPLGEKSEELLHTFYIERDRF